MTGKIYYCETCLNLRTEIVEMDEVATANKFKCPKCKECWRLNRGQVRHQVKKKLKQYITLAGLLGVKQ